MNRRQAIQLQRRKDLAKRESKRKLEQFLMRNFNRLARWSVPGGTV